MLFSQIPGPKGVPFLGCALDMKYHPLEFLPNLVRKYGEICSFKLGFDSIFLLSNPSDIHEILTKNASQYDKGRFYAQLKPTLGNGLVTSEGDFWKKQRKLSQPLFHPGKIKKLFGDISHEVDLLVDDWEKRTLIECDLHQEMSSLTLNIMSRVLLGSDAGQVSRTVFECVRTVNKEMFERTWNFFPLTDRLPLKKNRAYRQAIHELDNVVYNMIHQRKQSPEAQDDLLTKLVHVQDADTGERMSDRQLRDEVMTFFLAGHETTASWLTWMWYLLSQHLEAEEKIHTEILSLGGQEVPSFEDLKKHTYMQMCLKEAQRLYPPVWFIVRESNQVVTVGGITFPKNTAFMCSQWVMHHLPRYWEVSDSFYPENFSKENEEKRPKGVFFPFAAGPRACIGNHFASVEAQIILQMLIKRYRFSLKSNENVEVQAAVTLFPKKGLPVNIERKAVQKYKKTA